MVIQAMRASEKKSIEAATRRISSATTNGNNENA
jgi:hypothetical protein